MPSNWASLMISIDFWVAQVSTQCYPREWAHQVFGGCRICSPWTNSWCWEMATSLKVLQPLATGRTPRHGNCVTVLYYYRKGPYTPRCSSAHWRPHRRSCCSAPPVAAGLSCSYSWLCSLCSRMSLSCLFVPVQESQQLVSKCWTKAAVHPASTFTYV